MVWARKWVFLYLWEDPARIYISFWGDILFVFVGPHWSPPHFTKRGRMNYGDDTLMMTRIENELLVVHAGEGDSDET